MEDNYFTTLFWLCWVFVEAGATLQLCRLLTIIIHLSQSTGSRKAGFSTEAACQLRSCGPQALELSISSCSTACGIFPNQDWTHVSFISRWSLYHWVMRDAPKWLLKFYSLTIYHLFKNRVKSNSLLSIPIHSLRLQLGFKYLILQQKT